MKIEDRFTHSDIKNHYGIDSATVNYLANGLNIPIRIQKDVDDIFDERYFTFEEVKQITGNSTTKVLNFPEVIYVTRTIEIYESKINYTPLNQL